MRERRRVLLVAFAAAFALGACAELPFLSGRAEEGTPQAFEMQGRVYVRFGAKAFSGSLRWQHAPFRDEVWLGGPLGQTGAYIVRDSGGARLTTADQQVYSAMSIESLTRDGLGWSLPLSDLSYYVLGSMPPGASPLRSQGDGAAATSDHGGWSVRWNRREGTAADATPARLDLVKDDVEIRLVIDRLERSSQ